MQVPYNDLSLFINPFEPCAIMEMELSLCYKDKNRSLFLIV